MPDIADLAQVWQGYVRQVVHDFNEQGCEALSPQWSGGAPKTIDDAARTRICAIAGCSPHARGRPFSTWSLAKLGHYVIANGLVATISREPQRRIEPPQHANRRHRRRGG